MSLLNLYTLVISDSILSVKLSFNVKVDVNTFILKDSAFTHEPKHIILNDYIQEAMPSNVASLR